VEKFIERPRLKNKPLFNFTIGGSFGAAKNGEIFVCDAQSHEEVHQQNITSNQREARPTLEYVAQKAASLRL